MVLSYDCIASSQRGVVDEEETQGPQRLVYGEGIGSRLAGCSEMGRVSGCNWMWAWGWHHWGSEAASFLLGGFTAPPPAPMPPGDLEGHTCAAVRWKMR